MREIIKKILDRINEMELRDEEFLLFDQESKKKLPLNKNNFYFIRDMPEAFSEKKIAFVDGGSQEILKSPSFSLFFNRVYCTIYQKNKRIENKAYEYYVLVNAINKNSRIFYRSEYFFVKNRFNIKEYEFDSFDSTISYKNTRAEISVIGGIIRRFSELIIASSINSDYIVLDGSLEPRHTYEKALINGLKKNVYGLSKTSRLMTQNGISIGAYLSNIAEQKKEAWYYKADDSLYFVKLNKLSKHIFMLETNEKSLTEIKNLVFLLKKNSSDPVMPGYPYGLIEADRLARVSKHEKKILELELELKFKKEFKKIAPFINCLNAHDVLDSMG